MRIMVLTSPFDQRGEIPTETLSSAGNILPKAVVIVLRMSRKQTMAMAIIRQIVGFALAALSVCWMVQSERDADIG
jgi:hypothetical protein